jgi:hypothetical protein
MLGSTRISTPTVVGVAVAALAAVGASLFVPGLGADGEDVSVAAGGQVETPEPTSPAPAPAPAFVTGTRQGETVSVERRHFTDEPAETLFSYQEIQPYPPTDAAEPNRPQLAVSPDGRRVAYSDGSSIRLRDLQSGSTEVVVSGTSQGNDLPLRWSIPAMNTDPETDGVWGIWAVGQPRWSPDGRHLAFHQGWWEGSDFGIVDLTTGAYHASAGASDLEWLGADGGTAVAGSSYTEPGRVHVSVPGRPGDYRDVTAKVPGPEERHYDDVAVSPDGQRLAVSWAEESMGLPACCAALMNLDGTGFTPLAVSGNVQSMAFSADGSGLYLVERQEGRTVLTYHDGGAAPRELRVLGDLYHWDVQVRPGGALALLGRTAVPYEGTEPRLCAQDCPPFRSRLVLADPETGETTHESGDFDRHTAIDGFGDSIW